MNNACKNCTDRYIGCHSKCDKYAEFRNEVSKMRKHEREYNSNPCYMNYLLKGGKK